MGCGYDIKEGYVNQDRMDFKGVDDIFDFNIFPWPYKDNTFDEIRIHQCIQCTNDLVKFMAEVGRIAKPDAIVEIKTTNFLAQTACQDPYYRTHIGFFTFDLFCGDKKNWYSPDVSFELESREWIFSSNKYLKWLSPFFNILPRVYARFFYFIMPCNEILFKLRVKK